MAKTDVVKMRLEPAERDAFAEAASVAGISMSAWMRERLRRAAIRELADAGRQVAFLQTRDRQ